MFKPGDKVRIDARPGQHPAVTKRYRAEGVVILSFKKGDVLDRDIIHHFDGTKRMIGRSSVDRLVIRKENGSFIWAPTPMFRFITKIA